MCGRAPGQEADRRGHQGVEAQYGEGRQGRDDARGRDYAPARQPLHRAAHWRVPGGGTHVGHGDGGRRAPSQVPAWKEVSWGEGSAARRVGGVELGGQ